jgi:hypothetical protein
MNSTLSPASTLDQTPESHQLVSRLLRDASSHVQLVPQTEAFTTTSRTTPISSAPASDSSFRRRKHDADPGHSEVSRRRSSDPVGRPRQIVHSDQLAATSMPMSMVESSRMACHSSRNLEEKITVHGSISAALPDADSLVRTCACTRFGI